MPSTTLEVNVTVVPKIIPLEDERVYIYRDGKLIPCGALACILGHCADLDSRYGQHTTMSLRDHFDPQGHFFGEHTNVVEVEP